MPESFLALSRELQREAIETAASMSGRPDFLLEKDVWVVTALDVLFGSELGGDLVFKGGTSLSKGFQLIDRFSEDVDLTYDIRKLAPDFAHAAEPSQLSNAEAKKLIRQVRIALPEWLQTTLVPSIKRALDTRALPISARLEGSNVFLDYEPVTSAPEYVSQSIKLEFGARSTGEPSEVRRVHCDAAIHLPSLIFPTAAPRIMRAERTFWEKATAMHVFCIQARFRGGGRGFARHWHDLSRLARAGYAERAIADRALAVEVADHKTKFFAEKDLAGAPIDYLAAVSGRLQLVARDDAYRALEEDYRAMVDAGLLWGEPESFEALMAQIQAIEDRANKQL